MPSRIPFLYNSNTTMSNPHRSLTHPTQTSIRRRLQQWCSRKCSQCVKKYSQGFSKIHPPHIIDHRPHAEAAHAREVENANTSRLLQLPTEIQLSITEHMPEADLLALHISCRWFASLLGGTGQDPKQPPTLQAKQDFAKRLLRDEYGRQAAAEHPYDGSSKELLCRHCLKTHSPSAFSSKQKKNSPLERYCIGAQGSFRLCQHKLLSFEELRTSVDDDLLYSCRECDGPTAPRISHPGNGYYYVRQELPGQHVSPDEALLWKEFRNTLSSMAKYICPHMRTDNAEFQKRVLENALPVVSQRPTGLFHGDHKTVFSEPGSNTTVDIQCPNKHCNTQVYMYRDKMTSSIVIMALRLLSELEAVTDPQWCAQIEL